MTLTYRSMLVLPLVALAAAPVVLTPSPAVAAPSLLLGSELDVTAPHPGCATAADGTDAAPDDAAIQCRLNIVAGVGGTVLLRQPRLRRFEDASRRLRAESHPSVSIH